MINDDEELSDEQIQKIKKILLNPYNIQVIVAIALIIMAFFVGSRLGYIQGYSYVDGWYEDYTTRWCTCSEISNKNRGYLNDNSTWLIGNTINISEIED